VTVSLPALMRSGSSWPVVIEVISKRFENKSVVDH
jgi:hypothetical protein